MYVLLWGKCTHGMGPLIVEYCDFVIHEPKKGRVILLIFFEPPQSPPKKWVSGVRVWGV